MACDNSVFLVLKNAENCTFHIRAFSLYKTGSGFRYQIFSQSAEKIPN